MEFRFTKLRDLKVGDSKQFENAFPGDKVFELLAVSNKYGIVFVGTPNGVQSIFTTDIERDNNDVKKVRLAVEQYPHNDLVIANNICHLALSCDDNVLAVCSFRSGFVFADFYDVPSITKNIFPLKSFAEIKLTAQPTTKLLEFKWNPEVANMFAACLSDKTVSTYEITEGSLKIVGSAPNAVNASTISWSPKGKQIVIGKCDGTMAQHHPNLQLAKTIPAPGNLQGLVSVVSVFWLSTAQFAVLYNIDSNPCIMIVNLPKNGNPTFTNFQDICYSVSDQRQLFYYMNFLFDWNVLICSSSLSSDVSVLAVSKADQTWEQWVMDDAGRAELPLVGDDYTFPLGMAINLTSQRNIPIGETDMVPPKPLLHILLSGGLLCTFCIFNDEAGDKSLVKVPQMIPESKLKSSGVHGNLLRDALINLQPKPNTADPRLLQPTTASTWMTTTLTQSVLSNIPALSAPQTSSFSAVNLTPATQNASFSAVNLTSATQNASFSAVNLTSATQNAPFSAVNLPQKPVFTTPGFSTTSAPQATSISSAGNLTVTKPVTIPNLTNVSAPFKPTVIPPVATKPTNLNTISSPSFVPNVVAPAVSREPTMSPAVTKTPANITSNKRGAQDQVNVTGGNIKSPAQTALMTALIEEVGQFNNEVAQVRERILKSKFEIGSEEERRKLVNETRNLETFVEVAKEKVKNLNVNIHTLNGCVFDAFAAVEESRLLNERSKDPRYMSLHRNRPLDSVRSKKLEEIKSLFNYLQNQTQEVNDILDTHLQEFEALEKKSITSILLRPKVQLIYQSLASNKRIISHLQKRITYLSNEAERYCRSHFKSFSGNDDDKRELSMNLESSFNRNASLNELSNLMRNVAVSKGESNLNQTTKTVSPLHLGLLRNALEKRQVAKVSVTISDDDFSRFISPTAKIRHRSKLEEIEEDSRIELEERLHNANTQEKVVSKAFEPPKTNFEQNFSKNAVFEAVKTQTTTIITSTTTENKPIVSSTTSAPRIAYSIDVLSKSDPSLGTKSSLFSAFQPPSLFGDSKTVVASAIQPKSNELTSLTPGFTSTPAKLFTESTVASSNIGNKVIPKTQEESIINPIYEDITPPDSPSRLHQLYKQNEESFAEDDDDGEDYEDDEDYYDENDVEYEGEGDFFTEKEGSEDDNEGVEYTENLKLIATAASEIPREQKSTPISAFEVQTSSVTPTSAFSFKTAQAVIASPATESGKAPAPAAPFSSPFTSAVSVSQASAFSSDSAVKPVFSFAQTTATSEAATTTTHSFVIPSFASVTSTSPTSAGTGAANSSFFGKFASATTVSTTTSTETLTSTGSSIFGSSQIIKPAFEGIKSPFEQSAVVTTSAPSIFGTSGKSAFEEIPTTQSFSFASNTNTETPKTTTASGFGQSSSVFQTPQQSPSLASPFGQQPSTTKSGSLFGQPTTTPAAVGSLFGQQTPVTTSVSLFGQQTSTTSSGSLFGQQTTTTSSGSLFGQQTPTTSSGGGLFGQSTGFFSGLGGKPSSDANKNVFGSTSFGTPTNSNIFGNQSSTSFTTPTAFGSGSFSGSGAGAGAGGTGGTFTSGASPSVVQTGFGGKYVVPQNSPIKPGAFGGSPQFGSAPTFGGTPGGGGGFGTMGSHVFGSQAPPTAGFGSFAAPSDTPTFGSLASSSSSPTFNSIAQQPPSPFGQANQPTFGSMGANPVNPPAFGSAPVFGNSANNTGTGFSSPNKTQFSQWRG
ncbi:hypothetical protein CHUAL_006144 [Chamberlinius hualienensis]